MTSEDYLHIAFLLAKRANSKDIRPNPFVGAIVVDANGTIIGEGYHKMSGKAHAEVNAINDALLKSSDLSNCTLYVTLEPCSYTGKTPPCTSLILEHKIPKVVIGSMDPNPLVSGAKILVNAGVMVETCILPEIVELNNTFNINQIYKRPKYIIKSATTLNGKIADKTGNSKWISNGKSRDYVHRVLRTNADAILTTAQTVIKDNAKMNIRFDDAAAIELNIIIIDKQLDLLKPINKDLAIFYKRNKSKIYFVTDKNYENELPKYVKILLVNMKDGDCDLMQLSKLLLEKNICEVLVEAGGKLNASLIKNRIADELNVFIGPSLLLDNNALNVFNSNELQTIENCVQLALLETQTFDNDVFLKYKLLY
jgi:diaminohydroxyphosphoribosylaminopyrimidine deaminase/5-amino-6-(5-phosphoribosylamino)uracil reductase